MTPIQSMGHGRSSVPLRGRKCEWYLLKGCMKDFSNLLDNNRERVAFSIFLYFFCKCLCDMTTIIVNAFLFITSINHYILRSAAFLNIFGFKDTFLGPNYMANFSPGWDFSSANRAEISARLLKQILLKSNCRLHGEGFNPGRNPARAKNPRIFSPAKQAWKSEKISCNRNGISARLGHA